MRKIKNLVIGGIQSKIFNLILFTVLLLLAAGTLVSMYQNNMLGQLAQESGDSQNKAIEEVTGSVMDQVVTRTLERSNRSEARIAEKMFRSAGDRVAFLSNYATAVLAHPEDYPARAYAGPDASQDGTWTAKVIYADGVDPADAGLVSRIGLLANLFEPMISQCRATGAANAYIAMPEGAHLSVSDVSSSWFENGALRSYDPRTRGWYRKAEEKGTLVFTDGEYDANTGAYCIECAAPVYGPDGRLAAVVGTDLYLDEMQRTMQEATENGECLLLINQEGRAVLTPQEEAFPLDAEDRGKDLRLSGNAFLAGIVNDAVQGKETSIQQGELAGGTYYVTASSIPSTGWVLVSAFSRDTARQPVALMQERNAQIASEYAGLYSLKRSQAGKSTTILLLLVSVLLLAGAVILGKRIVKPLNTITEKIAELNEEHPVFTMEDAYRTGDEVEVLAESFARISKKTMEYVETVKQVTAEKERIGAELALATQIQTSMLPHIFPAFPDRKDFDIVASMDPAKEVGGDFYDYFLIDPDHLCMVMADVSGKGVPAALFMMASKIIIQSIAMMGRSPAEILAKTNDATCSNNETQMFVTVWLGILELSTGRLTAANAGHEYPAIRHAGGRFELYKDKHGFVLGGMEDVRYREYELKLEPGSKLFVYTDGVPEATSAEKELFGCERMLEALNGDPDAAPAGILANVRRAVDGFVKDAEQFDDLTMLCLEYKGPGGK